MILHYILRLYFVVKISISELRRAMMFSWWDMGEMDGFMGTELDHSNIADLPEK